ncbi:MAG: acyl-CoA dehydrogenase family protein [Elusimicrobia bacterium]|nr:acyl-CoA dehydrogenase family protein [Elusimicrobiota bacterium]
MTTIIKKHVGSLISGALFLSAPGSSAWAQVTAARLAPVGTPVPGIAAGAASRVGAAPVMTPSLGLPAMGATPSLAQPTVTPRLAPSAAAAAPIAAAAVAAQVQAALPSAKTAPLGTVAASSLIRGEAAAQNAEKTAFSAAAGLQTMGRAAKTRGFGASLGAFFDGLRPGAGSLNGATPARGGNAADQAADMLKGDKSRELFLPGFYWGGLELDALAKVPVNLEDGAQASLDAYKALIRYGLRSKSAGAAETAKLRSELGSIHTILLLKKLGITLKDLETPVMDTKTIDDTNDIPVEMLQRAVTLGLHKLKFPAEFGGLDLHQREYVQVLETIAPISPALVGQLSAQNTIGTAPLTMFGTEAQQKKYLPRLTSGEGMVAFGLTEPLAGTDLDRLSTTATLKDGKWKISGQKVFITGIMDAQMVYLVAGHTIVDGKDVGPTVFIVDDLGFKVNESWEAKKRNLLRLADRGMRITPWTRDGFEFMMIKGTDQGFIQLTDFEIPAENVLGPVGKDEKGMDGKKVPLRSLNKGRAGFAYLGASAEWFAERQLEWAADRMMFDMYAPKRGEEGRQGYMEFPATLIGRSRMKAEVLKVLSKYASALIDAYPNSSVAALSALIKVRASQANWENALDTLELGGGHALIKDAPGRVYQSVLDSWIARIVEGVNPAMSQFPHMMAGGKVMKAMGSLGGMLKAGWMQTLNFFVPFAVTSKGALSWSEAKYVQRRTAEFAMRFGLSALFLGLIGFIKYAWAKGQVWKLFWPPTLIAGVMKSSQIEFAPHQNTLIRAGEAQADILSLAMVQTELNTNKDIAPTRRWVLEQAVKVMQWQIHQSLSYMNPWGHPVENIQAEVGRRLIAEELANPGDRPNRVREHQDFLERTADEFHTRLRQEAGR